MAVLLGLGLAGLVSELGARVFFRMRPDLEKLRQVLGGDVSYNETAYSTQAELGARYIGQSYLNYVSAPGYRKGKDYHNEQGYRGKAVAMERTPGVARVLCLGGSTTYGACVEDPDQVYPAQLENLLRKDLPQGVKGVEVINGGLIYGTTAECLTHYHFKFHYYRPDVVVINVGGNDADALAFPYYQPDYSHWRKPLETAQPLAPAGRALLRSRLAAMVLLPVLYGREPANSWIRRPYGARPPSTWYPVARESDAGKALRLAAALPDADLAFTHNMESLIDEVVRDGATVLLVPYRMAPGREHWEDASEFIVRHERILLNLARVRKLEVAPFPAEVVSKGNWVDSGHLNEEGNLQKATHIAPFVRTILQRRAGG